MYLIHLYYVLISCSACGTNTLLVGWPLHQSIYIHYIYISCINICRWLISYSDVCSQGIIGYNINSEYCTFSCLQIAYVIADKTVQPSSVCESLEFCLAVNGLVGRPAATNSEQGNRLDLLATVHEAAKSRPKRRGHYQDQQPRSHTSHTACTKEALNKRSVVQETASNRFQDDGPLKILQLTDVHLDIFYQEVLNDLLALWYCTLLHFHF